MTGNLLTFDAILDDITAATHTISTGRKARLAVKLLRHGDMEINLSDAGVPAGTDDVKVKLVSLA